MYIIIAILLFGILIAAHEWGHFIAARLCGVTVHEFSIGMGPAIWHRTGKKGTQFSIRALPIGGYCAMEGEEEESDDPHSLNNQGFWKKDVYKRQVMIVDARHKPTADDVTMVNWFFDTGCPVIVVANKLDKLKKSEVEPNLALIRQTLGLREEDQLVPFSAEKGIGRESLRQMLDQMIEEDAGI